MAKFVHAYHLLCGHTMEEPMDVFERKKWESQGHAEYHIDHEDQDHRCYECGQARSREQAWRAVLEGEFAFGLSPLTGDRLARYVRLRAVQQMQQFGCNDPWFSPQTNQRLFQMYLDYIQLFPDALSWLHHCKPEAQWKGREFIADQKLRIQFQGTLPPAERRTYELRYICQHEAVVLRPVEIASIEAWPTAVNQVGPGESLVLSVRYYEDEVANREPWTLERDSWFYLARSPIHMHLLWSATAPSFPYYLAKDKRVPRVRRAFQVMATPAAWRILTVDLEPSWMNAGSQVTGPEKSDRACWFAYPFSTQLRHWVKTPQVLHLCQHLSE